jgi:hypothetical protein
MGAKGGNGAFSDGDIQRMIQAQAAANRVTTVTPFGEIRHTVDRGGSKNDNRAEIILSPQQQAFLEQSQAAQLMAGQQGQAQLGELAGGRQAVEQAYFDRAMGLLNPQFALQEDRLRQRLANQGLPQASSAFSSELGRFSDARNRASEQAALAAVLAGGQEQSRQTANALSLLGLGAPIMPQQLQVVPVTDFPYDAGGGLSRGQAALAGTAAGAQIGSIFGPGMGTGIGAGAGGLLGLLGAFA